MANSVVYCLFIIQVIVKIYNNHMLEVYTPESWIHDNADLVSVLKTVVLVCYLGTRDIII